MCNRIDSCSARSIAPALGDSDFVIAYAWAEVNVPDAKTVIMALGSDDGVKVWLNGKSLHENWIGRPVAKDDDLFPVTFQKGKNQLLLKVQDMQGDWGFCLRPIGSQSFTEKLASYTGRGNLEAPKLEEETPAKIAPEIFAAYVGEYELAPNVVFTVTKEGEQLYVQLTGQPRIEVFPRSETEFFCKVVKAEVTFAKDASGMAASLTLNQGGTKQTATRIKK